jgi:hypothetical protein
VTIGTQQDKSSAAFFETLHNKPGIVAHVLWRKRMNDQHNSRPRRMETVNEVGERIRRSKSWIHAAINATSSPPGFARVHGTRWDSFAVDRWIEEQFSKAEK